jgi:hypothetical protein
MATGVMRGELVSTEDLVLEERVVIDHETYHVVEKVVRTDGTWLVNLVPMFGESWLLEVAPEDAQEPMWERA